MALLTEHKQLTDAFNYDDDDDCDGDYDDENDKPNISLFLCPQTGVNDVPAATHAQLEHDAEVAAAGDLQLRVSHVPQYYCR